MYDDWDAHEWGWDTWLGVSVKMSWIAVHLLLLVVLVVRATRYPGCRSRGRQPEINETALPRRPPAVSSERMVDERLARGDIDE